MENSLSNMRGVINNSREVIIIQPKGVYTSHKTSLYLITIRLINLSEVIRFFIPP